MPMNPRDDWKLRQELYRLRIAYDLSPETTIVRGDVRIVALYRTRCRINGQPTRRRRVWHWTSSKDDGYLGGASMCSCCGRCEGTKLRPDLHAGRGWAERMAGTLEVFLEGLRVGGEAGT